jgi:hypothetical protein
MKIKLTEELLLGCQYLSFTQLRFPLMGQVALLPDASDTVPFYSIFSKNISFLQLARINKAPEVTIIGDNYLQPF